MSVCLLARLSVVYSRLAIPPISETESQRPTAGRSCKESDFLSDYITYTLRNYGAAAILKVTINAKIGYGNSTRVGNSCRLQPNFAFKIAGKLLQI